MDRYAPSIDLRSLQLLHRPVCLVFGGHLNECEPLLSAGAGVAYQFDKPYRANLREKRCNRRFFGFQRKVSNE